MSLPVRFRLALVVALCAGGAAVAQTPAVTGNAALPVPRAGLWQVTHATQELGNLQIGAEVCLDGNALPWLAVQQQRNLCTPINLDFDGQRYRFDTHCQTPQGQVYVSGEASGDPQREFQAHVRTQADPPINGLTTMTVSSSGRWIGACRPGQRPQQAVVTRGPTLDANTLNEILRQLPLLPGL